MRRAWLAVVGLTVTGGAPAAPWEFTAPLDVSGVRPGVFHHLDSAGRKNIAVSGGKVGIVWADNRSGSPQVYAAFKDLRGDGFTVPVRVSDGKAAYDPVIVALGGGRFVLGWEQDEAVWVRFAATAGKQPELGTSLILAARVSGQINIGAVSENGVFATWSQRSTGGAHFHIHLARLTVNGDGRVRAGPAHRVDNHPPAADQLYPVVAAAARGAVVAWEDRRHGHTAILYSHSADGERFQAPAQLNELPTPRGAAYGRGTGAARVTIARFGEAGIAAVWLDKRDFRSGYDPYAALSRDGGERFGPNLRVRDEFGFATSQWRAASAGHPSGLLAVAFDDSRDETFDVWLAWLQGEGWSGNFAVPGASGPGEHTSPVLAFDAAGDLHIAWLEREHADAPNRLRYAVGRYQRAGAAR
jgi:hypothetical protein